MRIAYFDCAYGVAGDMIMGALVDAGAPFDKIQHALEHGLGIAGLRLTRSRVTRAGVSATKIDVEVDAAQDHHRQLADVLAILHGANLPPRVKERAAAAYRRLAEAEARVHETTPEEIHFHEVGALDAIADVAGGMLALELLGIDRVEVSPIATGSGTARCAHGIIPVPAPATVELLRGVPTYGGGFTMEMATPTGAAILATVAADWGAQPAMAVEAAGYGSGTREIPGHANFLRVLVGEAVAGGARDTIPHTESRTGVSPVSDHARTRPESGPGPSPVFSDAGTAEPEGDWRDARPTFNAAHGHPHPAHASDESHTSHTSHEMHPSPPHPHPHQADAHDHLHPHPHEANAHDHPRAHPHPHPQPHGPDETHAAEDAPALPDDLAVRPLTLLMTEVDDMSPEILGDLMTRLFAAGCLDAHFTPIQMKKNRPAVQIQVLCDPAQRNRFVEMLLRETSTFGLKVLEVERLCLARRKETIETEMGPLDVKIGFWKGEVLKVTPEYESCRRLAEAAGLPLAEVYARAQVAIRAHYHGTRESRKHEAQA